MLSLKWTWTPAQPNTFLKLLLRDHHLNVPVAVVAVGWMVVVVVLGLVNAVSIVAIGLKSI